MHWCASLQVVLTLSCALLFVGCGGENKSKESKSGDSTKTTTAAPNPSRQDQDPGVLVGKVLFRREVPPPRTINATKDVNICMAANGEVQDVVVDENGGLRHVVVEIQGIKPPGGKWEWKDPEEGYVLRQKGCRFAPRFLVVRDGAKLTVHNDDKLQHNVNSGEWNYAQDPGAEDTGVLNAGLPFVKITCNIHNWMESWVYVARSPYHAATKADGSFRIENIPPGKYRATAVHPTERTVRFSFTIESGQEESVEVVYD